MPAFLTPSSPSFVDFSLIMAVVLTVMGVTMHICQSRHRMSVEERIKDRKLSEREGRWHLKLYNTFAPGTSALGILLLVLVSLERNA